jgi:DNA-directed RNA polymerase specialized sigma24 family protein
MVETIFEQSYTTCVAVASVRAAMIVKRYRLSNEDLLDLSQEALLGLCQNSLRFDAGRASWRTFSERVVANWLASCMRGIRAGRRGHGRQERLDELKLTPAAPDESLDLRIDVRTVLAGVSILDQRVAGLLIDHSPTETGRCIGLSRATIYRAIERLRAVFLAAGFAAQRGRLSPSLPTFRSDDGRSPEVGAP